MTRILFWLMMGAFLSSCSTPVVGSGVLYALSLPNGDSVRLHDASSDLCAPAGPEVKRATYVYRPEAGKPLVEGCYLVRDDMVLMIFADGDQGALPLQAFKDGQLSKSKPARTA
jgi:hypothetical protein